MLTAHGVQMSPRMERLYTFFQHERIDISSWSTDDCVKREYAKLQQALSELEVAAEMGTLDKFLGELGIEQLHDLAVDVRNIMRRTPDKRVI